MKIGDVVVKLNGRFAGRVSIVMDTVEIEKGYVNIAIPYAEGKVKMKRSNIKHILPMGKRVNVKGNERAEELWDIIKKEKLENLFLKRIQIQ